MRSLLPTLLPTLRAFLGRRPALKAVWLLGALVRYGPGPYALVAWQARTRPQVPALVTEEGRVTYAELRAQAEALARSLAPRVAPGERIGLLGRGGSGWVAGLLAAHRLGAEVTLLNITQAPEDWAGLVRSLGLGTVLHEPEYGPGLRRVPHPAALVALPEGESGWPSPTPGGRARLPRCPCFRVKLLTSGTTGAPRAVLRSRAPWPVLALGADFLARLGPRRGEGVWLPLPLFHGHGLSAGLLTLAYGGTLHLCRRTEGAALLTDLRASGAGWVVVVPTLLRRLLDSAEAEGGEPGLGEAELEKFGGGGWQVRRVISGSAPLLPELADRAQREFGEVLYDLYGSTETGPLALATPADLRAEPGCVGRPLRGVRLRVGEGTLWVRSPLLTPPDPATQIDSEGPAEWDTGDLAWLSPNGRLHLRGRLDDRLNCGGQKVDPEALEARLGRLPGIRECALWGERDAEYGQILHALVVPVGEETEEELRRTLNAALPRSLRPRTVRLCAELPRGPSGKLERRRLPEWGLPE